MLKQNIHWILRAIISLLFLISALAKMDPLWAFEKQMVDLNICSWCVSHYLARFILALELAIAILILLPFFLKKLTIPVTIALLVAFCLHLLFQIYTFGNSGNCGCFGQWLPMTPLQAFTKNIVTIGLLIWLYKIMPMEKINNSLFWPLPLTYLACALAVFIFFPFAPCKASETNSQNAINTYVDTNSVDLDTLQNATIIPIIDSTKNSKPINLKDTASKSTEKPGPKAVTSKFASFKSFGNKAVNLDQGKKIICMFAPGCDHCQEAAKQLKVLKNKGLLPPLYILFMDEEAEKIPDFFKISGSNFPYQVLDIPSFWKTMGADGGTPAVFYLWNGNIIKKWVGTEENHFEPAQLQKELSK